MILKIVDSKHPALRQKAKKIKKIDKKIKDLAKDLIDTLAAQKDPEGVGLAACQVGKPVAMFAFLDKDNKIKVVINPNIISYTKADNKKQKEKNKILEGCLSVPNFYGNVKRPTRIVLEYQDLEGKKKKETFTGFQAHIIAHEIDHLNGVLFTDHILKEKKPLFEYKNGEWEKVEI